MSHEVFYLRLTRAYTYTHHITHTERHIPYYGHTPDHTQTQHIALHTHTPPLHTSHTYTYTHHRTTPHTRVSVPTHTPSVTHTSSKIGMRNRNGLHLLISDSKTPDTLTTDGMLLGVKERLTTHLWRDRNGLGRVCERNSDEDFTPYLSFQMVRSSFLFKTTRNVSSL